MVWIEVKKIKEAMVTIKQCQKIMKQWFKSKMKHAMVQINQISNGAKK